ncbi:MBL fold metallo-hydrolase [Thiomicrorhabdus sediminis]|uniref:MBL fold metallo-hydrolase n=1 Tax=Thiomicrorhabdus sediminis TaxID=2580412 RepID=A0A4V1HHS5_9GAMM|nr:MBL fold metallo-hydrolase [Thiomicrorhabdus sediminis]QCU90043.1 MBL fold metallo-hydrolase [Thiomicrorhabdus sediminis]
MASQFELLVLGSGAGASAVYDNLTSSSFMLCHKGEPFCLVDLGLGVGQAVLQYFGCFPKQVIISHNHSDHAGDLPVVLRVELAQENKMRVICHANVAQRLKSSRIAEHLEQLSADELASWQALDDNQSVAIGHGLSIEFFPGVHSETSYGFVLTDDVGTKRLSYSADSTLCLSLYETLSQAEVFIMDARAQENRWHASFAEVKPWLTDKRYILGHGLTPEEAQRQYPDLPLLLAGQRIQF